MLYIYMMGAQWNEMFRRFNLDIYFVEAPTSLCAAVVSKSCVNIWTHPFGSGWVLSTFVQMKVCVCWLFASLIYKLW